MFFDRGLIMLAVIKESFPILVLLSVFVGILLSVLATFGIRFWRKPIFWVLSVLVLLAVLGSSALLYDAGEGSEVSASALTPIPSQAAFNDSLSYQKKIDVACKDSRGRSHLCLAAKTVEYMIDSKFVVVSILGSTPFGLQLLVAGKDGHGGLVAIWTNYSIEPKVGMPVKLRKTIYYVVSGENPSKVISAY